MGIIGEKPSGVWPKDAEARTAAACERFRLNLVAGKPVQNLNPEIADVSAKASKAAQKVTNIDEPEDEK